MHCSPDNARRQAQLRASPRPPSPCTRVRGIINTLETRVSSIGGCNNKRSGRPPMQVGGVKKWGGGGGVRCEGKRGADSCTNAELHKQAGTRSSSRSRTGRVWSVAWFPPHTHTRRMRNVRKAQQKVHEKINKKTSREEYNRATNAEKARVIMKNENAAQCTKNCKHMQDTPPLPSPVDSAPFAFRFFTAQLTCSLQSNLLTMRLACKKAHELS